MSSETTEREGLRRPPVLAVGDLRQFYDVSGHDPTAEFEAAVLQDSEVDYLAAQHQVFANLRASHVLDHVGPPGGIHCGAGLADQVGMGAASRGATGLLVPLVDAPSPLVGRAGVGGVEVLVVREWTFDRDVAAINVMRHHSFASRVNQFTV